MKQLNKCPNCGGLLPKSRTNTIICEYCGSEFVNPNYDNPNEEEILYADDKVYTKVIKPFGANEIARFEDGTPATSESVKKNFYWERGGDGRLHAVTFDVGMMTPHSNACNTEKIQLDTGHTMSRVGNSYMARIDPQENPQIVLQAMKRAVHKEDEEIPYEYFHDNKENQWKVRCYPW